VKNLKLIFTLIFFMIILLSSCGSPPSGEETSPSDQSGELSSESSAEEEVSAAEEIPTTEVVLEEDFSDPDSGWEHYNEFDGVLDYEQDGYRMMINTPENLFWVNAGLKKMAVVIEVEASLLEGPEPNWFGVVCRLDLETYDYYFFAISSEGYYGIAKMKDFELQWLQKEVETPSEIIRTGSSVNEIKASCQGDQLSLAVNGEDLLIVQDEDLIIGDIGLAVAALEEPGVDVLFDNLLVLQP
jgi:hypothetical protein